MRSRSLARVVIAGLAVSVVITPGCGRPPSAPSPPDQPPPPFDRSALSAQQRAALALFEAAGEHAVGTSILFAYGIVNGTAMWTSGPCAFEHGSLEASLDGGLPPAPETLLPTGSHTYAVSFRKCWINYWGAEVFELNGVVSAAYNTADWGLLTATVSVDSVQFQSDPLLSQLREVTAEGSAVWTRSAPSAKTETYTPATGSRLINNSTGNVATFRGGSYSTVENQFSPSGRSSSWPERRFNNLTVAINGTEYTLNGNLELFTIGSSGSIRSAGETRITSNGTLVARIYGDARNALTIEVLAPLVPF